MSEANDFQEKTKQLTESELKVLAVLHMLGGDAYGYGDCYWTHNSILSGEGRIGNLSDEVGGRNGLSKILKKLRDLDLVKFARGLMNDDGEVCGAGNAPNPEYEEDIEKLCEHRAWL